MGEMAASTLLKRIGDSSVGKKSSYPRVITMDPELIVRESTAVVVRLSSAVLPARARRS
jgi:DNA-binding LacI/PurR family transcriptional regulator